MPLTASRVSELLQPYTAPLPDVPVDWPRIYDQLAAYLHLLVRWNARVNLTAIHAPEEIVRRHFGESLFAGLRLRCSTWNNAESPAECSTWNISGSGVLPAAVLDFGSGAGFPGLPIQILWPELRVTLAEARHKKASFLREVVRTLGLHTEIWADRVENMPAAQRFPVVTMRAVDQMDQAVAAAASRADNALLILTTSNASYPSLAESFAEPEITPIPETNDGILMLFRRLDSAA